MIQIEIIKFLGDKLADQVNITHLAGRGLLKLSIKDEVGPFKPLEKLSYEDLKSTIQNALRDRLIKLEIINPNQIITFLLNELNKNQSLIIMAGV